MSILQQYRSGKKFTAKDIEAFNDAYRTKMCENKYSRVLIEASDFDKKDKYLKTPATFTDDQIVLQPQQYNLGRIQKKRKTKRKTRRVNL